MATHHPSPSTCSTSVLRESTRVCTVAPHTCMSNRRSTPGSLDLSRGGGGAKADAESPPPSMVPPQPSAAAAAAAAALFKTDTSPRSLQADQEESDKKGFDLKPEEEEEEEAAKDGSSDVSNKDSPLLPHDAEEISGGVPAPGDGADRVAADGGETEDRSDEEEKVERREEDEEGCRQAPACDSRSPPQMNVPKVDDD